MTESLTLVWLSTFIKLEIFVTLKQITSFIALATLALSGQLFAESNFSGSDFSGPDRDAKGNIVPTPKGENCVEETSFMRKNHMDLLLHKRDETVHKGIRTKKHSLTECINCHATPDEDGKIARILDADSKHFCSTCHAAVALSLDCFECHADRPVASFKQAEKAHLLRILASKESFKPHAVILTNTNGQHGEI